jgi:lipopolysaccharide export system permease protein
VLISDRTDPVNPFTVVAKEARFEFDNETATAHLRLADGDIHFEQGDADDDRYQRIAFEAFDYAFDMQGLIGAGYERLRPHEMTTEQLRTALAHFEEHDAPPPGAHTKRQDKYEIQLQRRLALPLAPLLFALIGVPLGLRRQRGARSMGVLICVGLVFAYYVLLSAAEYLTKDLGVPAMLAMWMPNAIFASIAAAFLWRGRKAEG